MCEIDGHEAIPQSLVGSTSRGWQLERLNRRDARRTRTAKNLTEQPISGRSRKGGKIPTLAVRSKSAGRMTRE